MRVPYISVDLGSLFTGVFPKEHPERCHRIEALSEFFNIEVIRYKTVYGRGSFDKLRFGTSFTKMIFSEELKKHLRMGKKPFLVGHEREELYRALGIRTIPMDVSLQELKEVLNAFQNITGQKIPTKRNRGSFSNHSLMSGLWEEE